MIKNIREKLSSRFDSTSHNEVPFLSFVKAIGLVLMAPIMVILIMIVYQRVDFYDAIYAILFITVFAIMFVRPYISNLSALTSYVKSLSLNDNIPPPNLSFLNNVEELTEAVSRLHTMWENNKRRLESMIDEGRVLIDTLPDGLVLLDSKLRILRVNLTVRDMFGTKHYKNILQQIIEDPTIKSTAENVKKSWNGATVSYFRGEPYNKHFSIRIEHYPQTSSGEITLVMMLHDVTEQKKTEKMLADFVANASHEIRTPLTSLLGFIETLQTTAKDDVQTHEEFLAIMYSQAQRMAELVRMLLSLSEIERTVSTTPTEKVDMSIIIDNVVKNNRINARERNIEFALQISKYLPLIVGDSRQLEQVVENIVNNAVKYSDEGSTISISADIEKESRSLVLAIKDQGWGIDEEHIPRLTERFYRVDAARSNKQKSVGLGLSIVKYILERHNAKLEIQSTIGKGSIFKILLPIDQKG